MLRTCIVSALAAVLLLPSALGASEWAQWRGPYQTGVSPETGLVSSWSIEGENLLWHAPFTGRSTPAVFNGRVCAIGRTGEGVDRQEEVACWNAETGAQLWSRKFNVYNTTVPFTRAGWAAVSGDPETGYLYAHGVDGHLWALDADGELVWEWNLGDDLGRLSGYGGRTQAPVVDEDQVILTVIGSTWGKHSPPWHRHFSFDKRTGTILWSATVSSGVDDFNVQGTPVVAVVGGQRLLIGGNADGWVYAIQTRTGKEVWRFHLSQRGINVSPVVNGDVVYIAHSEENVDEGVLGRVVAIDGTGQGDVTKTHELWRREILAGYASPAFHNGRLYVVDNSANLYALDGKTGETVWEINFGTVGKGSPVWADGKLYLTEVNGNFIIVKDGEAEATKLDEEHVDMPEGRYAEVYASPAIAYGRIYFMTENGLYAIGDKEAPFKATPGPAVDLGEKPPAADAKAAQLTVVPAEVVTHAGKPVTFEIRSFDAEGRPLGKVEGTYSLEGLKGKLDGSTFTADPEAGHQVGLVTAKAGDLTASARVRAAGPLPWSEDFEGIEAGKYPPTWIRIANRASVTTIEGEEGQVLHVPKPARGVPRHTYFIGPSDMSGYTIQADVRGTQQGRRKPDVGIINGGYTFDIQGNHQRAQIRSWAAELRMAVTQDFAWDMDTWYTMKMRVDHKDGKAIIRGKVWKRGDPEPEDWTITAEDPHPIDTGSAGLYGFSPVDIYFDNVKVTVSES